MAARNVDAAANSDPNGFHPSRPRDEPLQTGGHKPGVQVGDDAAPEFHAETLPAGTAPPDRTFEPQNDSERPQNPDAKPPSAQDTLGGATSADVHQGLGQPIQGQSSKELHHDGQSGRKNPGAGGPEGVGGTAVGKGDNNETI